MKFSTILKLILIIIGIAIFTTACTSNYNAKLDSWSVFHGNNQHTGVYDVEPIRSFDKVKWAFKTDGPIRGSAAVLNGTLFFGSGDGYLYAVDEKTGEAIWKYKSGGAVHSTPLVVKGLLVFTSRDKYIYALDPDKGSELWSVKTGENLALDWEFDYYLSSPILAENTIYVGAGDGYIYALNPSNGSVKWKTQTNGRIRTSPAYSDGMLYIGNMSGLFYALNAQTGEVVWDFEVDGLTSNFEDYGFDRASIIGAAAVKDNTVVFGSRDAFVYALDKNTGEEKWRVSQRGTSWAITTPAIVDSMVYMGTSDALFIHALNLETGEEIWKVDSVGGNWPSPVIAGDVLYTGTYGDEILGLNRSTGKVLWTYKTDFDNLATGIPNDRMYYTGSDDGFFYALSGSPTAETEKPQLSRTVHWDQRNSRAFHGDIKEYLVENNYTLLDSISVVSFMRNRVADKQPSVVVMAVNFYPGEILKNDVDNKPLLRQYLDAGGKVVWLGTVHLIQTRNGKILENYKNHTKEILGINYRNDLRGHKGFVGISTTPQGYAWGIRNEWWIGCCGVEADQVSTILATDEYGRASAWVKNYGGPEGTGYIRFAGKGEFIKNLKTIKDIAEYGLDQ